MRSCREFNEKITISIAEMCPKLKDIELLITGDIGIMAIADNCLDLKRLNLNFCQPTDHSLINISQHCPKLEALDTSDCRLMTDAGLVAIAEACHLWRASP